ncbi:MAG: tRNA (adenosine(37)-N6)-threonylcarbamoyltransferase complex dimerization subunit type 1 TsaB [Erysipelotrichaceae bacterium]|nr:tRNA (adenosine(37)-N6)-threonylcarbamoyltransferase complex dimerization subunit type 1 TsaB [Erysipelotrichaceae bacterium]MBQ4253467.1 tRNA (adenosine(37)-N6)-threonylcarbamoyltransferase complex dimerization subunit type 1 TsaB [Erysipelotrichaceae bacterium]
MYTLGIDTSHRFLLLVLIKDDQIVSKVQSECFKKQSEYIIPELDRMLKELGLSAEDIGRIVVTTGPGSYTGVRIGMTVAKVLGSLMEKEVYVLSTLQLYAGLKDCYVIMDARAKRVYCGRYKDGKALEEDCVRYNEEMQKIIEEGGVEVIGDLHLFGKEDIYPDLAENLLALKDNWVRQENVDILTPVYLKSNQEYLK